MNIKKILALVLALVLVCSLAACTTSGKDKNMENKDADKPADNAADMSGEDMSMTDEPKTAAEALEMHKKLLEQENEILSQNTELWEKVFMSADKGMVMVWRTAKTTATSCWTPLSPPRTSSPKMNWHF